MTTDPRLPTLEEVMNGNPFDVIDSPWGHIERWRASTLATGTMGALQSVYDLVRADSAAFAARRLKLGTHSFNIYAKRWKNSSVDLRTTLLALPQPKTNVEPMNKLHVSLRKSL
jgi:hypothetical protein